MLYVNIEDDEEKNLANKIIIHINYTYYFRLVDNLII